MIWFGQKREWKRSLKAQIRFSPSLPGYNRQPVYRHTHGNKTKRTSLFCTNPQQNQEKKGMGCWIQSTFESTILVSTIASYISLYSYLSWLNKCLISLPHWSIMILFYHAFIQSVVLFALAAWFGNHRPHSTGLAGWLVSHTSMWRPCIQNSYSACVFYFFIWAF